MARLPRLSLAGYPHHVIQRGNNRQAIFASAADHRRLLGLIRDNAIQFGVAIHAYVLMDNHFHLLATPQTSEALPKMMQAVGRSYVRYFNDSQSRSGTLWEGRYKSTLVQADRYLLACMAYIDLNPVRAGLVEQASLYPWSSHGHYTGRLTDPMVTPPALYWALGNTPFSREAAYAELVRAGLPAHQLSELTQSVLSGWALGDAPFVAELQKTTNRRLSKVSAGRPMTKKKVNEI
jgi:putative transposase